MDHSCGVFWYALTGLMAYELRKGPKLLYQYCASRMTRSAVRGVDAGTSTAVVASAAICFASPTASSCGTVSTLRAATY